MPDRDEDEDSKLYRLAGSSSAAQENLERHIDDRDEAEKEAQRESALRSAGAVKLLQYPSVGGQLEVAVTLGVPDGNSGQTSIRIDGTNAGNIWFNDEDKTPDSPRAVTLQLAGESEHEVLAQALRDLADLLDKA